MTAYQLPRWFRFANRLVTPLIRSGLPMGARRSPMALLTVAGRKTGILRTTPVALAAHDDGWLLISVNGMTDWALNLTESGEATIATRGRTTDVTARQLPPSEAARLLRASMLQAPALVRSLTDHHFEASAESSLEAWERDASTHPVFVLTPMS